MEDADIHTIVDTTKEVKIQAVSYVWEQYSIHNIQRNVTTQQPKDYPI